MTKRAEVDEKTVGALAAVADLPLPAARESKLAGPFREWLAAANELNAKMAAAEHRGVAPVTVFRHPGTEEGSDGER